MWGIRPVAAPPVPGLSRFHELNVRTYVHRDGVPGVAFLSLDAASLPAVYAARASFHLPYYRADIDLEQRGSSIRYRSRRVHPGAPDAVLDAAWSIGDRLQEATVDSLAFFLTERYCLYTERRGRLLRGRIRHSPWTLHSATLDGWSSTMVESHGLPTPEGDPIVHYAERIKTRIYPLRRVR